MASLAKVKPRRERKLLRTAWKSSQMRRNRLTVASMALIQKPRPALKQPARLMQMTLTLILKISKTTIILPFGGTQLHWSGVVRPSNSTPSRNYLDRHGIFTGVEMACNAFSILPGHLPDLCFLSET